MRKLLTLFLLLCNLCVAWAAIPAVNQYKIEKRPIAPEPTADQYTISAQDQTKVKKPPFSFFTQLNTVKPDDIYTIPPYPYTNQLPKIGKWSVAVETGQKQVIYVPAHWLDELSAQGQYIIEPINYIFIVKTADKNAAIKTLTNAFVNAGFTTKWSGAAYHSDNYHAYVNDTLLSQTKRKDGVFITFSNNTWLHENDHFRLLGAYKTVINNKPAYIFLASVSEESAWDNSKEIYAGHYYISFTHARDNLANGLIKQGFPTYYVLANNILNTDKEFTEDHDGKMFVTVFGA